MALRTRPLFDFVVQNGPAFREYFAIALQNDLNQVIDAVQSARSRLSEENQRRYPPLTQVVRRG